MEFESGDLFLLLLKGEERLEILRGGIDLGVK
jgi:hypothetical protein